MSALRVSVSMESKHRSEPAPRQADTHGTAAGQAEFHDGGARRRDGRVERSGPMRRAISLGVLVVLVALAGGGTWAATREAAR